MPFITEEIYSFLPGTEGELIGAAWPESGVFNYDDDVENIGVVREAIRGIRNAKAEMDIEPHRKSKLYVLTEEARRGDLYKEMEGHFVNLANITEIELIDNRKDVSDDVISVVTEKAELFLPMKDLVDYAKEAERLARDIEKTKSEIERADKKLSNENFVNKAKPEVVEKEREKLENHQNNLSNLEERMAFVKSQIDD